MRAWQEVGDRLSAEAAEAGESPTTWFDRLYAAGARGESTMPWDRQGPNVVLAEWLETRTAPVGGTAVQVGCGLGADAEHLASSGWRTTAFDVSPTAVELARQRHPGTTVDYHVANLFDLPHDWRFDLVVEIFTVQSLPLTERDRATSAVRRLVAPGGTLLVIQAPRDDADADPDGPPWRLTRAEMEAFADDGLELESLELVDRPGSDLGPLWRGVFQA